MTPRRAGKKPLGELQGLELRDATLALVAGMACWKTGDPAQAEKIWQMGADRFGANSEAGAFPGRRPIPARRSAARRAAAGPANAGLPAKTCPRQRRELGWSSLRAAHQLGGFCSSGRSTPMQGRLR